MLVTGILLPSFTLSTAGAVETGRCWNVLEICYFFCPVLGVTRASTRSEIAKAYRALARKHHPDMHQGDEAKAEAEIKFKTIAAAYEVLKDDASREDYDYMVDHPEEFYAHYYR